LFLAPSRALAATGAGAQRSQRRLGGAQPISAALTAYEQAHDTAQTPVYAATLAAQQTGRPVPPAHLAVWRALARLPEDAHRMINGLVRTADDRVAILARARALDEQEMASAQTISQRRSSGAQRLRRACGSVVGPRIRRTARSQVK
jgi:hypothetical protein